MNDRIGGDLIGGDLIRGDLIRGDRKGRPYVVPNHNDPMYMIGHNLKRSNF